MNGKVAVLVWVGITVVASVGAAVWIYLFTQDLIEERKQEERTEQSSSVVEEAAPVAYEAIIEGVA